MGGHNRCQNGTDFVFVLAEKIEGLVTQWYRARGQWLFELLEGEFAGIVAHVAQKRRWLIIRTICVDWSWRLRGRVIYDNGALIDV